LQATFIAGNLHLQATFIAGNLHCRQPSLQATFIAGGLHDRPDQPQKLVTVAFARMALVVQH
jgi:hypothetical protein